MTLTAAADEVLALARAWQRVDLGRQRIEHVETLQDERRRSVYRVSLAGPGPATMIAKRAPFDEASREITVYTELLPRLPMPALHLFGHAQADGDDRWLFIEEAVGRDYERTDQQHREAAGAWLGRFHAAADGASSTQALRDRGAGFFVRHLHAAIGRLEPARDGELPADEESASRRSMQARLRRLRCRWPELASRSAAFPRTYVHGDYKPENLRLRPGANGPELLAFDWNEVGYGPPALDLTRFLAGPADTPRTYSRTWVPALHELAPDLEAYLDAVRTAWPDATPASVRWLGLVGEIFVCVTSIRWEAEKLAWEESGWVLDRLRWYDSWLAQLLEELET